MKFPFAKYRVEGYSMWPTLVKGDKVLVYRWAKIRKGDIVVASLPTREFVKRVARIDGKDYFLEGDNKKFSTDSRHFGPVRKQSIVGKVVLKYGHDYSGH